MESSLFHRALPPRNSALSAHPTLILLHGLGADEEDLLGLSAYLDERLLILSVRAPYSLTYGGYTWYDIGQVGAPEPAMFKASHEKLSKFVTDALNNYPIERKHLYLLGFSMGAAMSFALSLSMPEVFRGVIANSGYIPEGTHLAYQWNLLNNIEFLVTHGTQDPVLPVQFGRRAKELLSVNNARFEYKEYPMGHQISEESLTDVVAWLARRLNSDLTERRAHG